MITALGASIVAVFAPTTISYARADALTDTPVVVVAPAPTKAVESLQEMADRIAIAHDISTTTLANLVSAESSWDPNAVGDDGCSYGLTQQNVCVHQGVTREMALDPETALTIAAEDIAAHREDRYTVCNCWAYVSTQIKNLPRMNDITPNGTPRVGAVAILRYKDKQTGAMVKHVAVIEDLGPTGFTVRETNYEHCLYDRREIRWNDPHLVGFWSKK